MCMICETARRARQRQEAERAREQQLRQQIAEQRRAAFMTVPRMQADNGCAAAS